MDEERKLGKSSIAVGACGGCLVLVGIVVAIFFVGLYKAGLVGSKNIPGPSRVVETSGRSIDSIKSDLTASLLRSLKNGEAQIVITEDTLTSLMRSDLLGSGADSGLDVSRSQIAILDGKLEVYIPIEKDSKKTSLTLLLVPTVNEGIVRLDILEVRLGTLKAPDFIADIPENLINDSLSKQIGSLGESINIDAIVIEDGQMTLSGKVILNKIPGL